MSAILRATPFHTRAAAANRANAWRARGGWTLAAAYENAESEALAARLTAALVDISWRWRVNVEGPRAEEFLARLLTRNPERLAPGEAFKALWLSDGGAVRGACALARRTACAFTLIAAEPDPDWLKRAGALFELRIEEVGEEEGGLALIGPYAPRILAAAGLDPALEPLTFRALAWRGVEAALSRFGEHGGYELWCRADDAPRVWDRLMRAGRDFALRPAGLDAADILDLEAGAPRPGRDYAGAREGFAREPSPFELGMDSLIDEDHRSFNGRRALQSPARARRCVGLAIEGQTPRSCTALMKDGAVVGRTLHSLYSPALRQAIALAQVDAAASEARTELKLASGEIARIAPLPFVAPPDPIAP
jgi:aminomethyltransferase